MRKIKAVERAEYLKKPFKKQLIGGYKRSEVLEYIETMLEALEDERKSIDAEKDVLAMVMLQSQVMADSIIEEAKVKADTIIAEAERSASMLIKTGVQKNMVDIEELLVAMGGLHDVMRVMDMLNEFRDRFDKMYDKASAPLNALYLLLGGKWDED